MCSVALPGVPSQVVTTREPVCTEDRNIIIYNENSDNRHTVWWAHEKRSSHWWSGCLPVKRWTDKVFESHGFAPWFYSSTEPLFRRKQFLTKPMIHDEVRFPKICQEIRHPGFTIIVCQASRTVLGDQILSTNILEQATGLKMHTRNQDTRALERFGSQKTLSKVSHISLGAERIRSFNSFRHWAEQTALAGWSCWCFLITNDFGYLKVICLFLGEGWERSSEFEAPHLGDKLLLASSYPIGSSMSMFELYTGVASHASMNMFNAFLFATLSMYQCSVSVTHASLSNVNSYTYNHLQFQPLLDDLMRKLVAALQICTSFDAWWCMCVALCLGCFQHFSRTAFCGLHEPAMVCLTPSSHPLRKQLEESFAKAGLHRILACQTCSSLFLWVAWGTLLYCWPPEKQRKSESHDHPLDLLKKDDVLAEDCLWRKSLTK